MSKTATRRAAALLTTVNEPPPAPTPASLGALADRLSELRARTSAHRAELRSLESQPRPGSDEERIARERRCEDLKTLVKGDEQDERDATRELDRAQEREDTADAAAFAPVAREILEAVLSVAEEKEAARKRAGTEVERVVARVFDPRVRRRLTADPTLGLRARLIEFLPRSHELARLTLAHEELSVGAARSQRWPTLVRRGDDVRYEGLERIRTAADFAAWSDLRQPSLPAGCVALKQWAELADRFRPRSQGTRELPARGLGWLAMASSIAGPQALC
jgi:hypothetical protein